MPTAASLALLLAAPAARSFPDGAPWEAAAEPEGCNQCHFDSSATLDSAALEIRGLPEHIEPGRLYRLALTLRDDAMMSAGFLLTATANGAPAGRFAAVDERTAVQGAQARSTKTGAAPSENGLAGWLVEWIAPAAVDASVLFDLWANAANGDESPFGDATHRRAWRRAAAGRKD